MDCLPQFGIPPSDVVVAFTDGDYSVSIPGCRIDRANITYTTRGHIVRVQILGPTWKWRYGCVSGLYNVRRPDGTVDPSTRKTPRELATLLFQAMHVPLFDVSGLPDGDGPEVFWQGANAISELTHLCHSWGCDFGLDLDGTVARIWQLGVGPALPTGGRDRTVDYGIDLAEPPDVLRILCGPTWYQSKLLLEPVGIDRDGTIKHINDLSYKPAGGWEGTDPFDPLGPDADPEDRRLAKRSYLRMWRVKSQADGTQNVPGYGTVPSVEYILPLYDELAADYANGSAYYRQPAYLVGVFALPGSPQSLTNTDQNEQCEVGWRLQREPGIVITEAPIFKYDANLLPVAADLYFVCSYRVRKENTLEYDTYSLARTIAANDTGEHCIHRPDIQKRVIAEYDGTTVTTVTDNESSLTTAINEHLDAAIVEFQPVGSIVKEYGGVVPISLTGATRQVMYSINCEEPKKGAYTIAAQNTEWEPGLLRRLARRDRAESRRAIREQQDHQRRRLLREGAL